MSVTLCVCKISHGWCGVQTTKIKEADINKLCDNMTKEMEKTVEELRKLMEKEKIAAEQERLRKIQVPLLLLPLCCLLQICFAMS